MTNETTQLWTDERISAKAQEVIVLRHTPLGAIRRVSYEIRDDYERERAELAALRQRVDAIDKERGELVFVEASNNLLIEDLERDNDRLRQQVTELEAQLAAAQGWEPLQHWHCQENWNMGPDKPRRVIDTTIQGRMITLEEYDRRMSVLLPQWMAVCRRTQPQSAAGE